MRPRWCVFVALAAGFAHAGEFSTRVVDATGSPLADVHVRIEVLCGKPEDKVDVVVLGEFTTAMDGTIRGTYKSAPKCSPGFTEVTLQKEGYEGYSDSQFKAEYLIRREAARNDFARALSLRGAAQQSALRELMLAEVNENSGKALDDLFLEHTSQVRDSLLALTDDAHAGQPAKRLVAMLALPGDMARILPVAPNPATSKLYENRWIYAIVTGLVEPTTEAQWQLLERAAVGDYDDGWVDAGAIQSLRLNASARSRAILVGVAKRNSDRKKMVARAVAYIDGGATAVADVDLVAAGAKAAKALEMRGWCGNGAARYSEDRHAALIESQFFDASDLLVYTATFHRVGDKWRLRAIRETMQALLPADAKGCQGN